MERSIPSRLVPPRSPADHYSCLAAQADATRPARKTTFGSGYKLSSWSAASRYQKLYDGSVRSAAWGTEGSEGSTHNVPASVPIP